MKNDIKVALCISGEMRTYKECFANLERYLIKELNPDIFIHTWAHRGGWIHKTINVDRSLDSKNIKALYKPKAMVVEEFSDSFYDKIDNQEMPLVLKILKSRNYKSTLPLYYKLKKCNDLKSKYEDSNDIKYDIVIRIRPDYMLNEAIPSSVINSVLKEDLIFYEEPPYYRNIKINDVFALGNSSVMDEYANAFNYLNEYWKNPLNKIGGTHFMLAEIILAEHVSQRNIGTKRFSLNSFIKRDGSYSKNEYSLLNIKRRQLRRIIQKIKSNIFIQKIIIFKNILCRNWQLKNYEAIVNIDEIRDLIKNGKI